MKRTLIGTATLLAAALVAAPAAAENRGIPLCLGDRASTAIGPAGDEDTYVFEAYGGTNASFTVAAKKGSGLEPSLEVLDPEGQPLDTSGHEKRKASKVTVRKLLLPITGVYALRVSGASGSVGPYELKTRGAPPKTYRIRGAALSPGESLEVRCGATTDACVKVVVKAKGEGGFEVADGFDPAGGGFPGLSSLAPTKSGLKGTLYAGAGFGDYGFCLTEATAPITVTVKVKVKRPKVKRLRHELSTVEPVVTSVEPDRGHPHEGVVIRGTSFRALGRGLVVLFGDSASPMVTYVSGSEITARVPYREEGLVDVTVFNPDGQEGSLADAFTVLPEPPAVSQIDPAFGPDTGGTEVAVYGTGLGLVTEVLVDGAPLADPPEIFDFGLIRFTTEAHAAGTVEVVLRDPYGQTSTVPGGFTYLGPPVLSAVSPDRGGVAGGTAVTITGETLHPAVRVFFGAAEATEVDPVDTTRLEVRTPAGSAGLVDVRVEDPWGRSATLEDAYEYLEKGPLPGAFVDVTPDIMPANAVFDTSGAIWRKGGDDLAQGDVDGDGDLDVVASGSLYIYYPIPGYPPFVYTFPETTLLVNDGEGSFTEYPAFMGFMGYPSVFDWLGVDDMALGDLDDDGDLDLVLAMGAVYYYWPYKVYSPPKVVCQYYRPYCSSRILLNDGTGYFQRVYVSLPDPSAKQGRDLLQGTALALGDLDGDDDLDLVITWSESPATSYWTYSPYVRYRYGYFYYYQYFSVKYPGVPATRVLLNDGDAYFTDNTGSSIPAVSRGDMFAGDAVTLTDVDGDGDLDIVVTGDGAKLRDSSAPEYVSGSKTRVLRNDGKGVFTNATSSLFPATISGDDWGGTSLALGDLDGDGTDDLVVATDRTLYSKDGGTRTYLPSTRVFLGGTGGFTEKTSTFLPEAAKTGQGETWRAADVAIADVDGDGTLELFLVSREEVRTGGEQVSSLRWIANCGLMPFDDVTADGMPDPAERGDFYLGDVLLLGDVDGDSDLDLVLSTDLAEYMDEGDLPTRLLEFR